MKTSAAILGEAIGLAPRDSLSPSSDSSSAIDRVMALEAALNAPVALAAGPTRLQALAMKHSEFTARMEKNTAVLALLRAEEAKEAAEYVLQTRSIVTAAYGQLVPRSPLEIMRHIIESSPKPRWGFKNSIEAVEAELTRCAGELTKVETALRAEDPAAVRALCVILQPLAKAEDWAEPVSVAEVAVASETVVVDSAALAEVQS